MKGPIFVKTSEGNSDSGVHTSILGGVVFHKSKAFAAAVARGQALGLTKEQVTKLMRP